MRDTHSDMQNYNIYSNTFAWQRTNEREKQKYSFWWLQIEFYWIRSLCSISECLDVENLVQRARDMAAQFGFYILRANV